MQQDRTALEDVQFLTGSPQRHSVLEALCREPARPHELCAQIDATRTTIQRILAGFRDRDWVVKHDGDYRATVTGRRICQQYEALLEVTERAGEFGPLATHLGPVADDLPIDVVDNGELTVSKAGSPLAALSQFTEWFRAVEGRVCAVTPVVAQPFNEIGMELLESGTPIEMVIDETVLEQSKQRHEPELDVAVTHDGVDVFVHESTLPVGVAFDRSRCCLIAYDDDSNMKAILESTDEALYEWTRATFERYRGDSITLATRYKNVDDANAVERGR
jgi:predicted transcriptional regulator